MGETRSIDFLKSMKKIFWLLKKIINNLKLWMEIY